jgi:hypothetical protein
MRHHLIMLPDGLVMVHRCLLQAYSKHQTSAMANSTMLRIADAAVCCDLHNLMRASGHMFCSTCRSEPRSLLLGAWLTSIIDVDSPDFTASQPPSVAQQ